MEQIYNAVGVLCLTSVAAGLLHNMGSFASTEKLIRFVCVMCITVTMFSASDIAEFEFDGLIYSQQTDDKENIYNLKEIIITETEYETGELIKNRLDEKNIGYDYVFVHILEQSGEIVPVKIEIGCADADTVSIKECIKDLTTEQTVLIIGEKTGEQ